MYRDAETNDYVLDGERAYVSGSGWERMPDTVWLDGIAEMGAVPAAIVEDRRWNGWACPWFTRPMAARVADACNAVADYPEATTFYWVGDVLMQHEAAYPEEPDYPVATIERDGRTLYGIGNASWCWIVGAPDADAS